MSNAAQVEQVQPGIEARASDARAQASALRKKAEATLAELQAQADPSTRSLDAWCVLRRELGGMLPKDISVDEVMATLGFDPGTLGGVEGHTLRAPKDANRPSLVTVATAEGEKALAEKLAGYTKAKYWVEGRKMAGGLLGGFLSKDEGPKHDPKPAVVVLLETGPGLREGLGIANESINGELKPVAK